MTVAQSKKLNSGAALADALDTPQQMAAFLQIAERTLLTNARLGRIPVVKINRRVFRFHRPTVLASLQ